MGIFLLFGILAAYRERVIRRAVLGWLAPLLILTPAAAFWAEAVLDPRFLIAATPTVCLLVGLGIASQRTLSRKLLALIAFLTATALPRIMLYSTRGMLKKISDLRSGISQASQQKKT